ncbi:MAG: hypothetical protein MK212_02065 [Saprospiraceae bacterium]|nr:hypothetical protein [Saprospiraceae bacterium]
MGKLATKLEEIEKRILKLIEQNVQYQRVCDNLIEVRKELETENAELRAALAKKDAQLQNTVSKATEPIESTTAPTLEEQQKIIRQQIDQYIQELDINIEWLSNL